MYRYEIIYVYKTPLVKHVMLRTSWGQVLHNRPYKGICLEGEPQALSGRQTHHYAHVTSHMPIEQLLDRASRLSPYRRYSIFYNCEHFLNELFGYQPRSIQLRDGLLLAGAVSIVAVAALARSA